MRLEDKIIILTGASSGIGEATALRFAKEGATVIAFARRKEQLNKLKEKASEFPGKIIPAVGDVTNDKDVKSVVQDTIDEFGRIDVLINNAGILDRYLSVDNMEDEVFDQVMEVNVKGPMRITREVINQMKKQKSGNIINTSSVGGLHGGRGGLAYVMSKHAIVGMTKHIGFMFQEYGIRCNAVAPGSIATQIGTTVKDPNLPVLNKIIKGSEIFPDEMLPVLAEPEEIANVMLFLASDESSFVNGEVIVADGGWTAF